MVPQSEHPYISWLPQPPPPPWLGGIILKELKGPIPSLKNLDSAIE